MDTRSGNKYDYTSAVEAAMFAKQPGSDPRGIQAMNTNNVIVTRLGH
jgi:hypothetical protein